MRLSPSCLLPPAQGRGVRDPSRWGLRGCMGSLHPLLSPGAQTAWRDLSLLCYGETEALGLGD